MEDKPLVDGNVVAIIVVAFLTCQEAEKDAA